MVTDLSKGHYIETLKTANRWNYGAGFDITNYNDTLQMVSKRVMEYQTNIDKTQPQFDSRQ